MAGRRPKGDGSLRKRSDGRWEGRYVVGRDPETGKTIYKNVLSRSQAECRSKLREAICAYEMGAAASNKAEAPMKSFSQEKQVQRQSEPELMPQQVPQVTVGEWLHTWYELYSKPNIRESTQNIYRVFIELHLIPHIGEMPLAELSGLRLQKLYQEFRAEGNVAKRNGPKGLSAKTVRSIHTMFHEALDQAVREGLIPKNPTDDCKPPKLQRKEMRVLKPEQIKGYLQAAADRNVLPMFYLELSTGLRRGELLALLWSDLDVDRRMISVSKSVQGLHGELKVTQPKTSHSIRKVMIPEQAVELLIQEHQHHPDNPYMFPSPVTGTMYHPDAVGRIHNKLLKDAGIEHCRFHDLRHTFATVALQNGVDVKTVSGMLGHYSSGFTLDTYTHITEKMQQDAAEKMGNFMKMEL